jgi:hypothetical protein
MQAEDQRRRLHELLDEVLAHGSGLMTVKVREDRDVIVVCEKWKKNPTLSEVEAAIIESYIKKHSLRLTIPPVPEFDKGKKIC